MKLYLVRHGQSVANEIGGEYQHLMPDPDLTYQGCIQAKLTSEFLREHHYMPDEFDKNHEPFMPSAIYSSPARRALKTSRFLGEALNVPVGIDVCLHEVGGAVSTVKEEVWGGLPRIDALNVAGDSYCVRDYSILGWWFLREESYKEALERVTIWLRWMQKKHQEDVVVVVGHGALFDRVFAVAFGCSDRVPWMSMHNAAVARIDCNKNVWKMVFWNQHLHLKDMLSY